ncbi:unnamed protein product [Caenorhabditis brenneri]
MENQRKRQLATDSKEDETMKKPATVKSEPLDDYEKGDAPAAASSNPILSSMIASPPSPPATKNPRIPSNPAFNYLTLFTAFRQFLNGYLQAGGDAHLVNTLANYAAALPMPPNPLKPLSLPLLTPPSFSPECDTVKPKPQVTSIKSEPVDNSDEPTLTLSAALGEKDAEASSESPKPDTKSPHLPILPRFPSMPLMLPPAKPAAPEATSEIQRLREAAFGRYKNVLCVICNEWICSRNRKNHIEAHLNYRPYKCSACSYARRREIFVIQHIKTQHKGVEGVEMLSAVDLHVALEVDRLADECVTRTRKLIDNMQEKKDGDFGENKDFDEKAQELMLAEEAEKKVVVIESVSQVRPKVANYHRRQRTKVLKKIYDTDVAKQAELKIVKDEEGTATMSSFKLEEGFEIKLEDLMKMVEASGGASTEVAEAASEASEAIKESEQEE